MSVFGKPYASHYDVFYAQKDYPGEVAFVGDIIHRHNPRATSVLDFGCGSARHAVEFVRAGFRVTGIDRSTEMVAQAQERRLELPQHLREQLNLMQGDVTSFRSAARF